VRGCALYYDTNKAKSRETKWSGMRGLGFRVSGSGFSAKVLTKAEACFLLVQRSADAVYRYEVGA